jgi:hypothetical protein
VTHRKADATAIVESEELEQLRICFLRDVSREDMLENMRLPHLARRPSPSRELERGLLGIPCGQAPIRMTGTGPTGSRRLRGYDQITAAP